MKRVAELQRGAEFEVRDLLVRYDEFVALEIEALNIRGNVIALIGHNGAGKSTLMKTILGLLPTERGTVKASSFGPEGKEPLFPERHMAFCPETGAVFADISVRSYVELWCRLKHRDGNYYRNGGSRYMDLLQIEPLLGKLGRELSKGQRRRVQTAIAFLTQPQLFLVDEPFDGLDVQKTNELVEIMLAESEHMSFVVSSHRMDVVERLSDCVVVLKEGKVATHGTVEQVCQALCPISAVVENVSDGDRLFHAVKNRFQQTTVSRIGQHLQVVGDNFELQALQEFVSAQDGNGARVEAKPPSLVDAMNHHLRGVAKSAL